MPAGERMPAELVDAVGFSRCAALPGCDLFGVASECLIEARVLGLRARDEHPPLHFAFKLPRPSFRFGPGVERFALHGIPAPPDAGPPLQIPAFVERCHRVGPRNKEPGHSKHVVQNWSNKSTTRRKRQAEIY